MALPDTSAQGSTVGTDNESALTGLYQDVFKRAPDPGGYQYWLNAMNTQGYTPEMVRQQFVASPEYQAMQPPSGLPSTPPAPDYTKIAQTYGGQSPLSVYNLLRYGSEQGGLQGASPFDLKEVQDWASQSGVLTPEQLEMARQGRTFTTQEELLGQPPATAAGTPEWFKQYIYAGGADDAQATQRGLDWVTQQGMRPQEAVNLWNQALGTNFNVSDLFHQTGSGPELSNFGDAGSWTTGSNAVNDPNTGMIKSSGNIFQRGNDAIVSDELFWNPNSPTGTALANKVKDTQSQGQRAGVVITPYAVFQGKATNDQLLNEIKNSGADFVALDPYLGWGVPADQLFDWTKNFIPQVNALGKEVKLVTQGFAKKGEEDAARSYNQQLLGLPGVSEFVNFGLEDWFPAGSEEAKQLLGSTSEWTTLGNDYQKPEKRTISGTGTTIGETGGLPTAAPSPAPSAAPSPAAGALQQAASASPQNLLSSVLSADPNIGEQLKNNYAQAYLMGEGSSFNDPGVQVGNYTLRSMPISYDFSGNRQGGGFEASTQSTNDRGLPLQTKYTYDDAGNITGSEVRYFTGSDSGVAYQYDQAGKLIGQPRGFDYSEEWKGTLAPVFSMIAPALGPWGMLANAAFQAGQGNYLGAIASGAGGLGGLAGGYDFGTGTMTTPGGTLGGIAQSTFQNIATGANVANALKTGDWAGALSAMGGSQLGADVAGTQIGDTGFTFGDAAKGASALMAVQNGQYGQALASLGQLTNSQNTVIAGRALSLAQALQSGNVNAISNAVQQFGSAMSSSSQSSDPAAAAFAAAKRAGATDEDAASAARAVTGGDAIDRATAQATGLPIIQGAIPSIEILDEEWGDLTQAQKDAAARMTLNIKADQAATPEEAAALAKSQGYGMFTYGGNRYTLGASVQDVLAAAGQTQDISGKPVDQTAAQEASKGFSKNVAIGTNFGIQAAKILKEKFGNDLSWIDQADLNAAASFVLAGKEDQLRALIDSGQFGKSGQNLGAGEYGFYRPRDITSVDRDYVPPEGYRIAGPNERNTATVAYDANGIPVYVTQSSGASAQRLTAAEQIALDIKEGRLKEGDIEMSDPLTGQIYGAVADPYSPSSTLARGIVATAKKGFGEQIGYVGDIINSDRLREIGGEMNLSGQAMTPDIVRQGQKSVADTLTNTEGGANKLIALWELAKSNPGAIGAAFGDWVGTELWQELLPVGGSVAAGKFVNNAAKLAFSEKIAEKIGMSSAVSVNAGLDGAEAYAATYRDVKDRLLAMGFSEAQANTNANLAGIGAAVAEIGASVIGEGPIVAAATKGIPTKFLRTTVTESPSEALASGAQETLTQLATQRAGTGLDVGSIQNQAIIGGLVGPGTTGAVAGAANLGAAVSGGTDAAAATGTGAGNASGTTTSVSGGTATVTNASGQTTEISVTNDDISSGNLTNNVTTAVDSGADAASVVSAATNAAANSGADTNAATNAAVNAANAAGANVSVSGGVVTSTQTQGGVTTNSTVDNNTGVSQSTSTNANTGTTTQSSSDANTGVSQSTTTNQNTGATTQTATDTKSGTTTQTDSSGGVNTQTQTNNNTGTQVQTQTDTTTGTTSQTQTNNNVTTQTNSNANTGVNTQTATDSNTNTSTTTQTDTNTNVTTQTSTNNNTGVTTETTTDANTTTSTTTDTNTGTTTQTSTNTNTGVTTQTSTNSGVTTETQTDTNTGVTTQTSTDTNTGVSTTTNTDTNTGVTTQTQTDTNTGTTTETQTDTNAGVTTQTQTDTNTGVTTQTTTDTNTNVTTQTTTDTNTNVTTETKTDVSTGVTTSTSTNTNTGVTTTTETNTTTGVTTQTTTDDNISVTTTTDSNTGVTNSVVTDLTTGTQIVVDSPPVDPVKPVPPVKPLPPVTPIDPVPPVKTVDPVSPISTVNPVNPVTTPPKTSVSFPSVAAASLPAFIGGGELGRLAPQFLESKVTQGYVDPLAQFRQAQEQFEREAMMQNIDPRLMQILSQRAGQEEGALGQAVNQPHYTYGQEDSIDDILGGQAANYAKGGYVQPLMAKEGGMALPLLAKEGGLPTHRGGREDFKHGKHVAGEGDGQSDDIPAWLADGEFVFPADVVSALGNGSTKAGTDKLYEMMHSIRDRARSKGPKDLPPPALKSPLDYLKSKR